LPNSIDKSADSLGMAAQALNPNNISNPMAAIYGSFPLFFIFTSFLGKQNM